MQPLTSEQSYKLVTKDKIMVVRYLVSFLDQPELKTFSWIPMITEHTHMINVIWTQTTKPADQRNSDIIDQIL